MLSTVSDQTFEGEVLAANTPVVVSFWAPWCGLCRMVEPLLQKLQDSTPVPIKLVRVNADENLRLANSYRLTALPTLLLFVNGQLRQRVDGVKGAIALRDGLQQMSVELELETMTLPSRSA